MSVRIFYYAVFALPFIFRGVHGLWTSGQVGMSRKKGWAYVLVWFTAYLALLGLAASEVGNSFWTLRSTIGYTSVCAGILLRLLAMRELREHYTEFLAVKQEHKVIDTGPYRYLRHPLHTGLMLEYVGLAVTAWSSASIAILVLCLYVFFIRNYREEAFLARELGRPYEQYMVRAHCLIDLVPRRWLAKVSDRAGFD